jgi:hypothetical protein
LTQDEQFNFNHWKDKVSALVMVHYTISTYSSVVNRIYNYLI